MYRRALVRGIGSLSKIAACRAGYVVGGACCPARQARAGLATAFLPSPPGQRLTQENHRKYQLQKACGLSSQASMKPDDGGEGRKVRRTEEESRKVAEHKAAVQEYKLKMKALRKEVQQETKDRRQAEAVSAALERRRIAKRQAAALAERKRKAAISIALNEKRKEKLKENYEAGFKESARIFFEREERKKNIHAIMLEELEAESKHWINTHDDVAAKITDDIWEMPGNNSAGGQISMPDEHLWRFSADVGLYNQEEEPSERSTYLRSRMYTRMNEMDVGGTYVRERRTRWDNDTRGLLKEADRLLRKKRPAPPGYMARVESAGSASRWKPLQEHADE